MNIENYIAPLLYRYQCVTLPGFGAFLTEIQSAKLVENTNSFFPPKKLISFNSNLKNNDGLLANHIAQSEKTSYEYAVSAIQFEVFNWKKTLEETGFLALKNIGELRLNSDQNIVFTPFDQTNFLTTSFGLAPFVSPLVKRELFEKKIEEIENTEEKEVIEFIPEFEPKKSYSFLKYAAIFVAGLGLIGGIGYPMYENHIQTQTLIVQKEVQKQVQNKIQEATFFIESPIPAVTLSVKEEAEIPAKMPYHVMANAFRSAANADKEVRKLQKLGYDAQRIPLNKSGLYPVISGSYNTFSEAQKAQKQVKENYNPDAWILIESL